MAYDAPTPADLKDKFAAFSAVADGTVQLALDEAARRVDTTWTEGDFANGRLLYAAHVLTIDGQGAGPEAEAFEGGLGLYKSRKAGGSQEVYADVGTAGSLTSTSYGRRFAELQRLNAGGPITTGGNTFGDVACSGYIAPFNYLPGW